LVRGMVLLRSGMDHYSAVMVDSVNDAVVIIIIPALSITRLDEQRAGEIGRET